MGVGDPGRLCNWRKPNMTTLVRDLMRSGLITCPKGVSLGEAAALLTRHRVHALVVVDGAGPPAGVLSLSDFVAHLAAQEPPERATIGDVMSYAMLVCREETPALEVARGLTDTRFP